VENKIERLEYAIGDNPLGPFKFAGVIMDESPTGCWTNHHSIIEFKNQWYLFYHHNDFSPKFDKARSVRVDSLFFNADGSIKKVVPTLRGVGVTPATKAIQLDRYSEKSSSGSHIDFLDTSNTFLGWKCVLENKAAWIQYNSVDFGTKKLAKATIRATAINGGTMQIRLDKLSNPVIAEFNLPANKNWTETTITTLNYIPGIHNIIVSVKDDRPFEIDWVSFK
jgi:hypothetical protein